MPGFAIRGLHYDIEKGLLLKLDSFLQIQLGSVYRGLTPVSDAEVLRLYRSRTVPIGKFPSFLSKQNMTVSRDPLIHVLFLLLKQPMSKVPRRHK